MSSQSSFWPPHNGTQTSREAAGSVVTLTGAMRKRVFRAIQASGAGLTCDEIEVLLEMPHQTASARVNELYHRERVIVQAGTRRTRSGRSAVVWVAR